MTITIAARPTPWRQVPLAFCARLFPTVVGAGLWRHEQHFCEQGKLMMQKLEPHLHDHEYHCCCVGLCASHIADHCSSRRGRGCMAQLSSQRPLSCQCMQAYLLQDCFAFTCTTLSLLAMRFCCESCCAQSDMHLAKVDSKHQAPLHATSSTSS